MTKRKARKKTNQRVSEKKITKTRAGPARITTAGSATQSIVEVPGKHGQSAVESNRGEYRVKGPQELGFPPAKNGKALPTKCPDFFGHYGSAATTKPKTISR